MCGITGANSSGRLSNPELGNLQSLLILNTFRGRDSTGLFDFVPMSKEESARKKTSSCLYWKRLEPAAQVAMELFEENLEKGGRWEDSRPELIVAHARAATKGAIKEKNAHPFSFKGIIGVHNGTINGTFKNSDKFETDSEALYHNIAEYGLEEALKEVVASSYNAAYALAYLSIDDGILNLIRNKERPLSFVHNGTCSYFSSDGRDLQYVMPSSAVGNDTTINWNEVLEEGKFTPITNTIIKVPENILLSLKAGEAMRNVTVKKVEPPKKVYTAPAYEGGTERWMGNRGPFVPDRGTGGTGSANPNRAGINPPIASQFMFMQKSSYKLASTKAATELNDCYAIELDGWLSQFYMRGLMYWRLMHKQEFVKALSEIKDKCKTNAEFNDKLGEAGLTKGLSKRLLKGDYTSLEECKYIFYSKTAITRVTDNSLKLWYSRCGKEFYENVIKRKEEAAPPSNIVPFNIDDKSNTTRISFYGNGIVGAQYSRPNHELREIKEKGCKLCAHPPAPLETLFWINRDEFLCQSDQSVIVEAYRKQGQKLLKSEPLLEELMVFYDSWVKEERNLYSTN